MLQKLKAHVTLLLLHLTRRTVLAGATAWVSVLVTLRVSACAFCACHFHSSSSSNSSHWHSSHSYLSAFLHHPTKFGFVCLLLALLFCSSTSDSSMSVFTRSSMQILVSCGTSDGTTTLCSVGVGDHCLSFLSWYLPPPHSLVGVFTVFQWMSQFSVFLFAPFREFAVASFSVVDLQSTYCFFCFPRRLIVCCRPPPISMLFIFLAI